MSIIRAQLQVRDPIGLHARPAAAIVELVTSSGMMVSLSSPGKDPVAATSALKLLTLNVASGDILEVEVASEDEPAAAELIAKIAALVSGE
jgi:phosphocarrier protein HPr